MRYLLFTVMLLSFTTSAKQLCPINDKISEDMRINEADFTKEKAEGSLEYLSKIVKSSETPFEWFSVPNATKFIHGYALRRKALLPEPSKYSIEQFCQFYATEGWYYD